MQNIVTIDGIPVFQALVNDADTGMLRISLVDDPAVQSNFVAFSAQRAAQMYAVQDEERRLVLGVVMRADFPIYRRDDINGEYYIIYKADTIRTMAEKYLAENRQNLVNLMHKEGTDQEGVQMVQYFIKGGGIAPSGFDHIADGSLFAEFHVTNDDVWAEIKAGTYKGFSLEGIFDLVPETDKDGVQSIVDQLHGIFKQLKRYTSMSKLKGLLGRIAKALVEFGNVTTDKGVLAWDGDEDLKAGDRVYIEDADGNRSDAPDDEYTTGDGKVIIVVDGTVSEIRDPEAEVATAPAEEETAEELASVATDNGTLEWDGDSDLAEGAEVFTTDAEGNRSPAADGDYVTEDGKTITVVDGKVAAIKDPAAEVAPEEGRRAEKMHRVAQAYGESYSEKWAKIAEAVRAALGADDFWLDDAGDDFAVVSTWDEDGNEKHYRYAVSWNEDGTANVADPVEVVPAYVTPEERDAADAAFAAEHAAREAAEAEVAQLKAQLARTPAAASAHEVHESGVALTGNAKLDRLARLAAGIKRGR